MPDDLHNRQVLRREPRMLLLQASYLQVTAFESSNRNIRCLMLLSRPRFCDVVQHSSVDNHYR